MPCWESPWLIPKRSVSPRDSIKPPDRQAEPRNREGQIEKTQHYMLIHTCWPERGHLRCLRLRAGQGRARPLGDRLDSLRSGDEEHGLCQQQLVRRRLRHRQHLGEHRRRRMRRGNAASLPDCRATSEVLAAIRLQLRLKAAAESGSPRGAGLRSFGMKASQATWGACWDAERRQRRKC